MPQRSHSLLYGHDRLTFKGDTKRFPALRLAPAPRMEDWDLQRLLVAPTVGPSLDKVVEAGEDVLIVLSDASRKTASEKLLPLLLERLGKIGAGRVRAIIATGMHRPATEEELKAIMGTGHGCIEVLQHDGRSEDLRRCEPTSRGTPVDLNPALFEADKVLAIGAVTFHYHAGFTGGPKSIFPGLGGARGILRSHLRSLTWPALERHPAARPGVLEGNPVWEDLNEAASRRPADFLIQVVTDPRGEPVAAASGDPRQAHRSACEAARRFYGAPLRERVPLVVVSAGGSPRDRDLVQAHKAMEHASYALEEGGAMVLAARLEEGPGSEGFREWLSLGSPEAVRDMLRDCLGHRVPEGEAGPPAPAGAKLPGVYAQTALLLLDKARRFRIFLVSEMPDEEVRAMGITPAPDVDAALRGAEKVVGEKAQGLVLRHGAELVPMLDEEDSGPS